MCDIRILHITRTFFGMNVMVRLFVVQFLIGKSQVKNLRPIILAGVWLSFSGFFFRRTIQVNATVEPQTRPRQHPSTFFPVQYSLNILPLNAM